MRACACLSALLFWLAASLFDGVTAGPGILQPQNSTPHPPTAILTLPYTPLNTTESPPILVPVPGSDICLHITYLGPSWFATSLLKNLLSSAYGKILASVNEHPDDLVAPLPWFHKCYSTQWHDTIAIRMRGNGGRAFTWRRLSWTLAGLLQFMEDPRHLHPLNFDVYAVEEGVVAAGVLWYSQSPAGGRRRRLE